MKDQHTEAAEVSDAHRAELELLRGEVLDLSHAVLKRMMADLQRGSVGQRNAVISRVAPFLLKGLETREDDSTALKSMKVSFDELVDRMIVADDAVTVVSQPDEPLPDLPDLPDDLIP